MNLLLRGSALLFIGLVAGAPAASEFRTFPVTILEVGGSPLDDVELLVERWWPGGMMSAACWDGYRTHERIRRDEFGRWRIKPSRRPLRFIVRSPWHHELTTRGYDPGELVGGLSLTLESKERLRGRLLLAGEPVEGAEVRLVPEPVDEHFGPHGVLSATSDPSGRFELPIAHSGAHALLTRLSDASPGSTKAWRLPTPELDPERTTEWIDFDPGGLARLLARVHLPDPVRDHYVQLRNAAGGSLRVVPDAAGWIDVPDLGPGRWRAHVERRVTPEECFLNTLMAATEPGRHVCGPFCSSLNLGRWPDYLVPLDLEPGAVLRTELDFASGPAHALRGRVTLHRPDDSPLMGAFACYFAGPSPEARLFEAPGRRGLLAQADEHRGEFRLEVAREGAFELEFARDFSRLSLELRDRVLVSRIESIWECELDLVLLEVRRPGPSIWSLPALGFRWRGEGDLRARGRLVSTNYTAGEPISCYAEVPAGRIEVFRSADPEPREPVATGIARVGERLVLELP